MSSVKCIYMFVFVFVPCFLFGVLFAKFPMALWCIVVHLIDSNSLGSFTLLIQSCDAKRRNKKNTHTDTFIFHFQLVTALDSFSYYFFFNLRHSFCSLFLARVWYRLTLSLCKTPALVQMNVYIIYSLLYSRVCSLYSLFSSSFAYCMFTFQFMLNTAKKHTTSERWKYSIRFTSIIIQF